MSQLVSNGAFSFSQLYNDQQKQKEFLEIMKTGGFVSSVEVNNYEVVVLSFLPALLHEFCNV